MLIPENIALHLEGPYSQPHQEAQGSSTIELSSCNVGILRWPGLPLPTCRWFLESRAPSRKRTSLKAAVLCQPVQTNPILLRTSFMLKVLNLILFSSATRMHSSTWICRLSTDFWTDNNSCHQSAQLSLFHTFSCFTYLSDSSKLKSGHCWLGVSTSPITFHQYLFLSPRLISQLVLGALYVFKQKVICQFQLVSIGNL